MAIELRIVLLIAVVLYFIIIIQMLRKKKLILQYSLLWLFFGIVMLLLLIFPNAMQKVTALFGIEVASNGLFAFAIFAIIVIMVFFTAVLSASNNKIKSLTQKLALVEERLRRLEAQKEDEKIIQ